MEFGNQGCAQLRCLDSLVFERVIPGPNICACANDGNDQKWREEKSRAKGQHCKRKDDASGNDHDGLGCLFAPIIFQKIAQEFDFGFRSFGHSRIEQGLGFGFCSGSIWGDRIQRSNARAFGGKKIVDALYVFVWHG